MLNYPDGENSNKSNNRSATRAVCFVHPFFGPHLG